eukprot:jgi/Mesvir1/6270/Mv19977-RA.2
MSEDAKGIWYVRERFPNRKSTKTFSSSEPAMDWSQKFGYSQPSQSSSLSYQGLSQPGLSQEFLHQDAFLEAQPVRLSQGSRPPVNYRSAYASQPPVFPAKKDAQPARNLALVHAGVAKASQETRSELAVHSIERRMESLESACHLMSGSLREMRECLDSMKTSLNAKMETLMSDPATERITTAVCSLMKDHLEDQQQLSRTLCDQLDAKVDLLRKELEDIHQGLPQLDPARHQEQQQEGNYSSSKICEISQQLSPEICKKDDKSITIAGGLEAQPSASTHCHPDSEDKEQTSKEKGLHLKDGNAFLAAGWTIKKRMRPLPLQASSKISPASPAAKPKIVVEPRRMSIMDLLQATEEDAQLINDKISRARARRAKSVRKPFAH